MPMTDFTFDSPQEHIAFLEQQLAGAVGILRQKDETEMQIVRRYDGQSKKFVGEMKARLDAQMKHMQAQEKAIGQQARRYRFLRAFQVQIWKLGIAASEAKLDELLDVQIAAHEDMLKNKENGS